MTNYERFKQVVTGKEYTPFVEVLESIKNGQTSKEAGEFLKKMTEDEKFFYDVMIMIDMVYISMPSLGMKHTEHVLLGIIKNKVAEEEMKQAFSKNGDKIAEC